jgi:hypothetical protein
MQRAFVAALVVGTLCSTIGTYVVLRKLSFIGDGIAHASFAGIVVAYLRGLDYYVGARRRGRDGARHRLRQPARRVSLDTAIGVLFTGAFALGVFLMSRLPHYNVDCRAFCSATSWASRAGISADPRALRHRRRRRSRCSTGRCSTRRSIRSWPRRAASTRASSTTRCSCCWR